MKKHEYEVIKYKIMVINKLIGINLSNNIIYLH